MNEPNIADWITACAACITALTLIGLIWQVRSDHDRARRERALELLRQWDEIRTPDSFRYERLMFELSAKDVAKIQAGQPVEIQECFAEEYLPDLKKSDGKYVIDAATSRDIRSGMLTLLNTLENMALAYKHGVADREILDEAYYYLLIEKDLLRRCRNFMDHFGGGAWLALNDLPSLMKPAKSRRPAA